MSEFSEAIALAKQIKIEKMAAILRNKENLQKEQKRKEAAALEKHKKIILNLIEEGFDAWVVEDDYDKVITESHKEFFQSEGMAVVRLDCTWKDDEYYGYNARGHWYTMIRWLEGSYISWPKDIHDNTKEKIIS